PDDVFYDRRLFFHRPHDSAHANMGPDYRRLRMAFEECLNLICISRRGARFWKRRVDIAVENYYQTALGCEIEHTILWFRADLLENFVRAQLLHGQRLRINF